MASTPFFKVRIHHKVIVLLLATAASTFVMTAQKNMADSIADALSYQIQHYPASQYRDVYKNFMQDFFGPGHLMNDPEAASRYLKKEIESTETFGGPLYEPTGFRGNFYRVNLSLVADGTIPYDTYFEAFANSISHITPPEADYWRGIWNQVDCQIRNMGLTFENEQQDRTELADRLLKGDFIVHHSQKYNDSVNFHYRIISRENFNKIIKPYIKN